MLLFVDTSQACDGNFKLNKITTIPCMTKAKIRGKPKTILYETSGFTLSDKTSAVGNLQTPSKTTFPLYPVGSYRRHFYYRIGYLPIQDQPNCYVSVWERFFIINILEKMLILHRLRKSSCPYDGMNRTCKYYHAK